jgi:hypothetical protein
VLTTQLNLVQRLKKELYLCTPSVNSWRLTFVLVFTSYLIPVPTWKLSFLWDRSLNFLCLKLQPSSIIWLHPFCPAGHLSSYVLLTSLFSRTSVFWNYIRIQQLEFVNVPCNLVWISLNVSLKFKYQRFQQRLVLKIGKYWLHVTAREQRAKEKKT